LSLATIVAGKDVTKKTVSAQAHTNINSSAIHKPDVYATHNIMSGLVDILNRYV